MRNEAWYKGLWKFVIQEYASIVAVVILGIVFLPVVIILYCVPSIRETFKQLAYEAVMRD